MDPSPSEATPAVSAPKVHIMLQPVGDAPILIKRHFQVEPARDITWLTAVIRKMLKLTPDKSLFFYVSQTFAPSPDHTFEVLSQCYMVKSADGSKDMLTLQYSTTPAWG